MQKTSLLQNQLRWLLLSFAVIILDQLTKWLISTHLVLFEKVKVLPFFNLFLSHNTGAAFGFLNQQAGWQRWLFTLIAIIISAVIIRTLYKLPSKDNWTACALALILGGALGNLYDRIIQGYVTDFISLHAAGYYFATFNLADSAITLGVILWIIITWCKH